MRSLRRRLQKLEARCLDSKGLVVNSPAWVNYWTKQVLDPNSTEQMPFEFYRYILEIPDDEGETTDSVATDNVT